MGVITNPYPAPFYKPIILLSNQLRNEENSSLNRNGILKDIFRTFWKHFLEYQMLREM
jgi:hypothetical protein